MIKKIYRNKNNKFEICPRCSRKYLEISEFSRRDCSIPICFKCKLEEYYFDVERIKRRRDGEGFSLEQIEEESAWMKKIIKK
jgi:hypothetical protein